MKFKPVKGDSMEDLPIVYAKNAFYCPYSIIQESSYVTCNYEDGHIRGKTEDDRCVLLKKGDRYVTGSRHEIIGEICGFDVEELADFELERVVKK
jgi:hypothetical protein